VLGVVAVQSATKQRQESLHSKSESGSELSHSKKRLETQRETSCPRNPLIPNCLQYLLRQLAGSLRLRTNATRTGNLTKTRNRTDLSRFSS